MGRAPRFMSSRFQRFAFQVPLMQLCTNLELLIRKRPVAPPDVPHELRLTTAGGQPLVALQPPSGPVPQVITCNQRWFLLNSVDGQYRECHGYHVPCDIAAV